MSKSWEEQYIRKRFEVITLTKMSTVCSLLLYPEDESNIFLWNAVNNLQIRKASQPRIQATT
jgi:hypothetical protein